MLIHGMLLHCMRLIRVLRVFRSSTVKLRLVAILFLGITVLKGDSLVLGYSVSGTATGFFGGVDVHGWYSADLSNSAITVSGPPNSAYPYIYLFTGKLDGPGYIETSQMPAPPCILGPPCPGVGQAGLHIGPNGNSGVSLFFADTGEDFTGIGTLASGLIDTGLQGGSSSSPTQVTSPGPVVEITGSITQQLPNDYYIFQELFSGPFSVTATVPDPSGSDSYSFSLGVAGNCSSEGTTMLNAGDSYTGTIAIPNLPSGQYCVGISSNNPGDPPFNLIFNTPVSGITTTPEPSAVPLTGLLVMSMALAHYAYRGRRRSIS